MNNHYQVVILGKIVPEANRLETVEQLCALFNSTPEKMERLLLGKEVALKTMYSQQQAKQIQQDILAAGVTCEIRPVITQSENIENDMELNHSEADQVSATEGGAETANVVDDDTTDKSKQSVVDAVRQYIGSNSDYYCQRFSKFGDFNNHRFVITWHWPGCLFFSFWALYRKQWKPSVVNAVIGSLLLFSSTDFSWFMLWMLLRGSATHYLYFLDVKKNVAPLIAQNREVEHYRGGTSRRALWLGIIAYLLTLMALIDHNVSSFLQQHEAELSQVAAGSSSQTRGDGSVILLLPNEPELTTAAISLSYLALSIRILSILANKNSDSTVTNQVVEQYIQRLSLNLSRDPWGQLYRLSSINNVVTIQSAGPDRVFDNNDDLIQRLPI